MNILTSIIWTSDGIYSGTLRHIIIHISLNFNTSLQSSEACTSHKQSMEKPWYVHRLRSEDLQLVCKNSLPSKTLLLSHLLTSRISLASVSLIRITDTCITGQSLYQGVLWDWFDSYTHVIGCVTSGSLCGEQRAALLWCHRNMWCSQTAASPDVNNCDACKSVFSWKNSDWLWQDQDHI